MRSVSKVFLALCVAACGPATNTPKPIVLTELPTKAAVTPKGLALEDPTTAMIGAAGGSLTSNDGMVTITVDPGTVPDGTLFSAQAITNNAPGGFGTAFRLSKPDSVQFAKPVTLTFRYLPRNLIGTAPSYLRIATQLAGGTWRALTPTIDLAKQTMTVTTTTFSDWGPMTGLQVIPYNAEVRTKKQLQMYLKYCRGKEYPDEEHPGETLSGIGIGECTKTGPLEIKNWSVNGTTGGNSTVGTIVGNGGTAVFTAPDKVPSPDTVTVSVELPDLDSFQKEIVLTNVRIVEFDGYVGNLWVKAKATSSGETITMLSTAKLRFHRSYSDSSSSGYDLVPESEVDVTNWRSETSSRVCTQMGKSTVLPDGFLGDMVVTKDPDTYGFAGSVTLRVPALCTPKSGGTPSMQNFDGLAFLFGTGPTSATTRAMPDREFVTESNFGLNINQGGKDGVVVTQQFDLGRTHGD